MNDTAFGYTVADLFSGCGGLSLGLKSTGAETSIAVELSPMAAETFWWNFIKRSGDSDFESYVRMSLIEQAKAGLVVAGISEVNRMVREILAGRNIDVVAGGPPCQGFSLAGRRNREDARNSLPWEFLDFVSEAEPKIVVMENVAGMASRFQGEEDSVFNQLAIALKETPPGYVVQKVLANAKHYGAPQNRPRLLLVGLRSDLAMKLNVSATEELWTSQFTEDLNSEVPDLVPRPTQSRQGAPSIRDAIRDLSLHGGAPSTYVSGLDRLFGHVVPRKEIIRNHNLRSHTDLVKTRFAAYQYMKMLDLPRGILNPMSAESDSSHRQRILDALNEPPMPAIAPSGLILGRTVPELADLLLSLATKKHSQRVLGWDEQAGTVVTIGDDYVHPEEPRVFSVRELARFQGFPDGFEFRSKETTGGAKRKIEVPQYSQVGNAVSPLVGRAVGVMISEILSRLR